MLEAIENDKTNVACNMLGAFLNQVEGFASHVLTEEEAQPLLDLTNAARNTLGC